MCIRDSCKDPVIYIDDRWLYDQEAELSPIREFDLKQLKPKISCEGNDITILASGYSSYLARQSLDKLKAHKIFPEIIDVRVLNPLHIDDIINSVKKTRKLLVIDSGWISSGFSAELIAKVIENLDVNCLTSPVSYTHLTLPTILLV